MLQAVLAACLVFASVAQADEAYPANPLKVIVSLAPGGGVDTLTRHIADRMPFAESVVVESRPGAGGAVALTFLATQPADGYTVAVVLSTALTLTPLLGGVDYQLADFTPLAVIMRRSSGYIARADAAFQGWDGFLDYAKKAGAVSYGSQSQADRLIIDRIAKRLGIRVNVVPTKGAAEIRALVQGGHLDFGVSGSVGFRQTVEGGPLQLLLVTDPQRHLAYPRVPTLREVGIDLALSDHVAFVAPPATPPEIAAMLAESLLGGATDPAVRQLMTETIGGTPLAARLGEAAALLESEAAGYADLVAATQR